MKGERKIVVDDQDWRWRVGRNRVIIMGPNGERHYPTIFTITGCNDDIFGRGQWKKTSDGMITPRQIANYIRNI